MVSFQYQCTLKVKQPNSAEELTCSNLELTCSDPVFFCSHLRIALVALSRIDTCSDLTTGFWQMELEEESRQYTAFSVPGKAVRFHWCVAPMGLQGSPASFTD
jgi:hypothetical protein